MCACPAILRIPREFHHNKISLPHKLIFTTMYDTLRYLSAISVLCFLISCYPQAPVTSVVIIDMESPTTHLNHDLYGLAAGNNSANALRSELINNGDFNGGDSLPGWTVSAPFNYIGRSASRPAGSADEFSLMVSANPYGPNRRGGVAADGFNGLSVRRGQRYNLSFYIRTSSTVTPAIVEVALEDSTAAALSLPLEITPTYDWVLHRHSIIATADCPKARLTFTMRESSFFLIDEVSLAPAEGSDGNGLRSDAILMLDSVSPAFILAGGGGNMAEVMAESLGASLITDSGLQDWKRYCANEMWFTADHNFTPGININGLGCAGSGGYTLRSAVAQACFLIRAEGKPQVFDRIAFNPVAGRYGSGDGSEPLIFVEADRVFASPLYYLLRMFSPNRGNVLLPTEIKTYSRPQVEPALPSFSSSDESFEAEALTLTHSPAADSAYNYEIAARLRPLTTSPTGNLQITPTVFLAIETGRSVLYRSTGNIIDTLSVAPLDIRPDESCSFRIICRYDTIQCYAGSKPIHRAVNPSLPSLAAIATLDNSSHTVILKVVNTTFHDERTRIVINGARLRRNIEVTRMDGDPSLSNDPSSPNRITARTFREKLPRGRSPIYNFPPNSITLIKIRID